MLLKGRISVQGEDWKVLERLYLTLTEKGFPVEKLSDSLIVKVSELKDFVFQTQPGKVFWDRLILKVEKGTLSYSFIYRTQMQAVLNFLVTAFCFFAFAEKYPNRGGEFWLMLALTNLLVLGFSIGSAFHSKYYILKSLTPKLAESGK